MIAINVISYKYAIMTNNYYKHQNLLAAFF